MSGIGPSGGGFAGLGLQMLIQQMLPTYGSPLMPMGVNDRNLFDRLDQLRVTMQHREFMSQAVEQNRGAIMAAQQGGARLLGMEDNAELQRAMNRNFSAYAQLAPILYESPGFASRMDSLFGHRGDMAGLGHHLFAASRRRFDLTSGTYGMPGSATMALYENLSQNLFSDANYGRMPLAAGATGEMYRELSARGLAPTMDPSSRDSFLRGATVSPEIASFSGRRTAETVRQWAGAVEAVREIFGDQGNPNAPMPQLINMLNQLTGGAMTQLNPGRLEEMVRTTRNLAKNSGLGMGTALAMSQQGMIQAQQIGLDPVFGPIAAQFGMSAAAAYQGSQAGQFPSWQLGDIDQLTQAAQRRALGFFRSPLGNRVGLTGRLENMLRPGSMGRDYLDALRRGDATFRGQSINMSEADFVSMMASSTGMSQGQIFTMLHQTIANQQPLAEDPRLSAAHARVQANDYFNNPLGGLMGTASGLLANQLKSVGVRNFRALSQRLSSVYMQTLQTLTPEQLASGNEAERDRILTEALRPHVAHLGARGEQFLLGAANTTYGGLMQYDPDMRNRLAMSSPEFLEAQEKARLRAQAQGVVQSALAPFGKGSLMTRFMEGVISGEGNLRDLARRTIGVTRAEEIMRVMGGSIDAEGRMTIDDAGGTLASILLKKKELADVLAGGGEATRESDALRNELQHLHEVLKPSNDARRERYESLEGYADAVADDKTGKVDLSAKGLRRYTDELLDYLPYASREERRALRRRHHALSERLGGEEFMGVSGTDFANEATGGDFGRLFEEPLREDARTEAAEASTPSTIRLYINDVDQGDATMVYGDPQGA